MSDAGWGIVFVVALTAIVSAVITVTIWQAFKTQQRRIETNATIENEAVYRTLLEDVGSVQRDLSIGQRTMIEELAQVRLRLTAIETLLREVG